MGEDTNDLTCPECGIGPDGITGVEVRGVYDGVLYWKCMNCGWAWNRWSLHTGLHKIAQKYVDEVNRDEG